MKSLIQKNNLELDLYNKINYIHIKNKIAITELELIKETFSNIELYKYLLNIINLILKNEPDYFLFNNIIDRCQELINYGRFNFNTKSYVRTAENFMILELNKLYNLEERQRLKRKCRYTLKEIKLRMPEDYKYVKRELNYDLDNVNKYENSIVKLIGWDSQLLFMLTQKVENPNYCIDISTLNFLSSTRFLLENMKELYLQNNEYVSITHDYLDLIRLDKDNKYKKNIKVIQKRLNSINK